MPSAEPTIKVRRHSEPERVIYAGAPAGHAGAPEGADLPVASPSEERLPDGSDHAAHPAPGAAAAPADAFHETTLDDIESSTMPRLQKGIIVGAVLLIVACIVWYVLFMS